MKKTAALLALPLTALILLAGCGSDDSSSDSSGDTGTATTQTEQPATNGSSNGGNAAGEVVELQADPSGALAYEETSLTAAKPGKIQLDFTNDSPIGHDVVIEQDGKEIAKSSVITGTSEVVDFEAKPGEYTFYCSVPGHRQAGMEGTLTVK